MSPEKADAPDSAIFDITFSELLIEQFEEVSAKACPPQKAYLSLFASVSPTSKVHLPGLQLKDEPGLLKETGF